MDAETPRQAKGAAWLMRVDGDDVDWLRRQLSTAEHSATARIRSPRRRAEYAASRALAKVAYVAAHGSRAVDERWHIIESGGLRRSSANVALAEYAVVGSGVPSGPPALLDVRRRRCDLGISIAHRWPFVASNYQPGGGCGIDVERLTSFSPSVERHFLAEAAGSAAQFGPLERRARLTFWWTMKEAAYKAFRPARGSHGLADVQITDFALRERSADGSRLECTATFRIGHRIAAARVASTTFERVVCTEVRM
jgi:4'-phosphopantetheinyl transferase EntD